MGIRLGHNDYGKSRVRLLRVARDADRHDIKELNLAIRMEGDFETAHTVGDNSKVLATDTMETTVYALAQQKSIESAEEFCRRLIEFFLANNPPVRHIPGATGTPLILTNVQFAQNGFVYTIIASNLVSTASTNMTLHVIITPAIQTQPQSLIVTNTQSASFTVVSTNGDAGADVSMVFQQQHADYGRDQCHLHDCQRHTGQRRLL